MPTLATVTAILRRVITDAFRLPIPVLAWYERGPYVAETLFAKVNGRTVKMQDSQSPRDAPSQQSGAAKQDETAKQDEPKLKTQLQAACRRKGYALSTERTYWRWIVRFVHQRASAKGDGSDLIHPRRLGMAVALGLCVEAPLDRPPKREDTPASSLALAHPAARAPSGQDFWN